MISVPMKHRALAKIRRLKRKIYHTCKNHTHNICSKKHVYTDKLNTSVQIIHTALAKRHNIIVTVWRQLSHTQCIKYYTPFTKNNWSYLYKSYTQLTRYTFNWIIKHICPNHTHSVRYETQFYDKIDDICTNQTRSISYETPFKKKNLSLLYKSYTQYLQ
jgi:hypothetical protein